MSDLWRPSCSLAALTARAEMLSRIRGFFARRNVLEVQTATIAQYTVTDVAIESIAAGAAGYLQTSPEYQLKRLLASGAPSLYQLGPVYRAGERGRLHNPEFTLLEWYRLGYDDQMLMAEVAELVDQILGVGEYSMLTYGSLVADLSAPRDDQDLAFSEAVDGLGPGRFFVYHYPAAQAALARLCEDDPSVAARFELIVDGVELANGYFELTDPDEQQRRFAADIDERKARGLVEPTVDGKFLAALEAGLPDCAGVALGVDRLLMLQQGAASLDEVMPFPAGIA